MPNRWACRFFSCHSTHSSLKIDQKTLLLSSGHTNPVGALVRNSMRNRENSEIVAASIYK
jgi:hypothetical protein